MGDPDDHSGPRTDAALAAALGRDVDGLLAVHDAYAADLVGYAEFVLAGRTAVDPGVHPADEAAAAVRDALLAGTVAVTDLHDAARFRAWLLALTRNECLRRRPDGGTSSTEKSTEEAAELGRRGLRPAEVSLLLGFAPASLPRRLPAPEVPPFWLRAALADGWPRARELARRARPFDQDGFPVPLDRRRLSGRALAWSAAAVVLVGAGLLIGLPVGGDAAAAPKGPVLAAASVAAAEAPATAAPTTAAAPLPTLAETPFGSPRPAPAADRGGQRRATPTPAATTPARTGVPQKRTTAAEDDGGLAVSWSARSRSCGGEWTARLHATGAANRVLASTGGSSVVLHRDGDGWTGDLTGLPTDRPVTVYVLARGQGRPSTTSASLTSGC